jgi:hypothetical protein
VAKAQQRYHTKPVLDENGQPKRVPVLRKDGTPKVTKRGKTVTMAVTERDLTRPKDLLRCDFPGCTIDGGRIQVGTPYMWIKPKSGPYGGHLKARHAGHPAWQVWDYSSSLSAQVARIAHDAYEAVDGAESEDDVTGILENAAQEVRDLAEQKRDGASNIEDGFGHPTSQSEELEQQADDLDSWADDIESAEVPSQDEYLDEDDVDCDECQGTGTVEVQTEDDEDYTEAECETCGGTGQVENEDPETDLDAWREAVTEALSVVDECPV